MVSKNSSEFTYIDDDMALDAHYWAENVEGTEDVAITPSEALTWFQDLTFVQNLLKATDERWENSMGKDIILVETLARNDTNIWAAIATLQKTADQNKALAWKTLSDINKRNHMRKFNRVIKTRRQVSKKPSNSLSSSQPFISAPLTPPPLTRDALRTLSSPHSAKLTQTCYSPYAGGRRLPSSNPVSLSPKDTAVICKQMEKLITPELAYKLQSAGRNTNSAKKESASQRRLAEINMALQQNQKKQIPTSTQLTAIPSSSRRTQSAGPLPSQTQAYKSSDKGKNVVRKHPYPNNGNCYFCGKHGHFAQDCLERECCWCNKTRHFPWNCSIHPQALEEERRNNFYDMANQEDHWDEDVEANIMGEPYGN